MRLFNFSRNKFVGVVEYAGTICAGKMTILEVFKREVLKGPSIVEVVAKDVVIASEMGSLRSYYERQLLLAGYVLETIVRSRDRLLLVHRGLYDAIAFLSAYIKAGLAPKEAALAQIKAWRISADEFTDIVILVKTPAEVAYSRAKEKFKSIFQMEDRDKVFHRGFFDILEECYSKLEKQIPPKKLIVVDGRIDANENVRRILDQNFLPKKNPGKGGKSILFLKSSAALAKYCF